mmetsp:Transcript_40967/g.63948  ORF Transcript_40967/g.63948 Transcript_40967/m.63948 type:complete len:315 (+) Transcript_40967:1361-2305(+)
MLGRKGKAPRHDDFFFKSKVLSLRSRAAFKLIEIEGLFNVIKNSSCIIDLCSFPGSWLQVIKKFSKKRANIIGVDLKFPFLIPGIRLLNADITSVETLKKLKFFIKKNSKGANLILNDGSPRLGENWEKDIYLQNLLVLNATKIAIHCLLKDGSFVTKIFRSKFINGIIYLLRKFFKKVHTFKPNSSRSSSSEIFLICKNFLPFRRYDNRIFNPEWLLGGEPTRRFKREVSKFKKAKNSRATTFPFIDFSRKRGSNYFYSHRLLLFFNETASILGLHPLVSKVFFGLKKQKIFNICFLGTKKISYFSKLRLLYI